jgi:tRNA A-37 threonylcarbamoyl transferase component Bud32
MNTMKKCSTCGSMYSGDLCPKCMAGFAQKSTEPTAPPEELPLRPGQSFHGLEILELLGKGGMGVVYKARQPALDRMVALKILPQKMALDPDFQNRFIREAKALGSLNHPNIVAVYDFGAEGGLFFFAMEFVDGTNLRQILRDRKLTPEQALKIVPQLCDALEYAHTEGVVHRDIKPENILLDKKGRVKIADFGLAKLVGADIAAAGMLTVTNMVMGTPHYMAPEQVENPKGVDHRADIYAIGVVFYEMLTGELPIGRFELPSKKVQIDVRLDEVVLKALEKSPERRYQNASDIKEAVTKATASASAADSYSPTVITPRPESRKKPAALVLGILVAVAIVGIALVAALSRESGPPAPAVTAVKDPTPPVPVPVPVPAAPLDLTKLHFGPDERPGHYVFQGVGTGLPRNPMPCKEPSEIDVLISSLDIIGLQNIARDEIKQGYLAAWFRWEFAFVALETTVGERLEQQFLALHKMHNKWSYRKGPLLVLAWGQRKERRPVFVDLVARLQKKLGLPEEAPEIPLENLKLERSDLPSEWVFREAAAPTAAPAGLAERYEISLEPLDGDDLLELRIWVGRSAKDADAFSADKLGFAGRRKVEVRRAGRTVAALALTGDDFHAFERVAKELRELLGFPPSTFETIALAPEDVPAGFSIDKIENDPAKVLQLLGVNGVLLAEVPRAAYYRMKPQGMIVLLETKETRVRSAIEGEIHKTGISWSSDQWVCGVEGPDDQTLDALENRMRAKFGWDPQHTRYVTVAKAKLLPADLPAGYALGKTPLENTQLYSNEIQGPQGVLKLRIIAAQQHPEYEKGKKFAGVKPADVVLASDRDYVAAFVGGGTEADWPALDLLEAALRKRMRVGPLRVDELSVESLLPEGCKLSNRRELGFPQNPRLWKSPTAVQGGLKDLWAADLAGIARAWSAVVDPAETQIFLFQAAEGVKTSEIALRLRRGSAASKHLSIREKGSIVAVVRTDRPEDTEFKAIDELVRAKLRLK